MYKVIEIAERVSAVANLVKIDGRVSWVPPDVTGFEPYYTYLVESDETLLVIDPGMVVHWPAVHAAIEERLAGRRLMVFNTRSELECIASLGRLMDSFDNVQTITSCPLNPFDLMHRKQPQRMHPPSAYVGFGESLQDFGFAHLHSLRPVIKMLGTSWLYDSRGKVLFSTDCFGGDFLATPDEPLVRTTLEGAPDKAQLRATMLAKFDWLENADTELLRRFWDGLFDQIDVEVIAPTHGRIQSGKLVASQVLNDYSDALLGPVGKSAERVTVERPDPIN
ncbi:MAG: hypothetical protein EA385_06510 [Salinarimonadaceae bacterium]|nr:MAG: hypothetical protein EA385_06510 [Salinarimonadaceae bacterium]